MRNTYKLLSRLKELEDGVSETLKSDNLFNDSDLWHIIGESYTKQILLSLYKKWISKLVLEFPDFFDESLVELPEKAKKTLMKDYLIMTLYVTYMSPTIFKAFWQMIPLRTKRVFDILIWSLTAYSAKTLEKTIQGEIIKDTSHLHYVSQPTDYLHPEFLFFCSDMTQRSFGRKQNIKADMYLPDGIRYALKEFVVKPDGYHLSAVKIDENDYQVHTNQGIILDELPLFLSYVKEGQLKLSKTDKVLKASLRELDKISPVSEFYEAKDLQYIRTELIVSFLREMSLDIHSDSLGILKALFEEYAQGSEFSCLDNILFHVKGRSVFHNHSFREERDIGSEIWKYIIRKLPPNKWVSLKNIIQSTIFRELEIDCIPMSFAGRYLYITVKGRWADEKVYISSEYYNDVIIAPLLAGCFFMFAAFGLVDIAYEEPKSEWLTQSGKEYLSVFDGLRYVRLTDLGAYLTKQKKSYKPSFKKTKKAILTVDDKRLLFSMEGEDHLKRILIERFAVPIDTKRFRVSYDSLLKRCVSKKDVQEKIDLFHAHVSAAPPVIWDEFFKKVLDRVNPLSPKTDIVVYQLKKDPELWELMARDKLLKESVLKVEKYHVAISKKDFSKVKRRLESFGYLMD